MFRKVSEKENENVMTHIYAIYNNCMKKCHGLRGNV